MVYTKVTKSDVIFSIQGGIGNQLFEWSFGYALQSQGKRVLFDPSRCRGERPFEIAPLISSDTLLSRPVGLALIALERSSATQFFGLRPVTENGSGYHSDIAGQLTQRSYLRGYFQSPRYFAGHEQEIRSKVLALLAGMLTPGGRELAKELSADKRSVAIHIRRGDYTSDPQAAKKHGVLEKAYYAKALARLEETGHTRRVWFSDDLAWVEKNLAEPGDLLCPADATSRAGGEIYLMASCSSRVIANSSFSWWAGWLGNEATAAHPVIAPAQWFAGSPDTDAADLVPAAWERF